MQPDTTIEIQQFPILDNEGTEYGFANEAHIDLYFDGDDVYVHGIRFQTGWNGVPIVIPEKMLGLYEEHMRKHYDSYLDEARIEWLAGKGSRIADDRNRAAREAV